MMTFRKRTALRIGIVSLVLGALASPYAWFIARERAEQSLVALASEESQHLLRKYGAIDSTSPNAKENASLAVKGIAGGIFDIAEIYDAKGIKLAESMTPSGSTVEPNLPHHGEPNFTTASYESIRPSKDVWLLRVLIPLRGVANDPKDPVTGYFEGVRVVPQWQREEMTSISMVTALMVGLASLICGLLLYPVVLNLSADNVRKARDVLDSHISMMEALGRAIAKRDSDTGAHNFRVAWIAARIGEVMGLEGDAIQELMVGSFLHDVGKIGIPDAILLKPGKLDEREMATMRTHVAQGEEIVNGIGWLKGASKVVAGHHEKWNGTGYPRQISGEAIPLAARIFAVADVFDALCSKRPYKEPMEFDTAMAILHKDTGTHFDPAVMAAFSPIAKGLFDRLANTSECDARSLMEERVREHFGLLGSGSNDTALLGTDASIGENQETPTTRQSA
jgi:HD-GYP domain-containing protein (c-di-GMP phosphodiesterase class II)